MCLGSSGLAWSWATCTSWIPSRARAKKAPSTACGWNCGSCAGARCRGRSTPRSRSRWASRSGGPICWSRWRARRAPSTAPTTIPRSPAGTPVTGSLSPNCRPIRWAGWAACLPTSTACWRRAASQLTRPAHHRLQQVGPPDRLAHLDRLRGVDRPPQRAPAQDPQFHPDAVLGTLLALGWPGIHEVQVAHDCADLLEPKHIQHPWPLSWP